MSLTLLGAAVLWGQPAVIARPDCPSPFMMDLHARHAPASLGVLTRDGYLAMPDPKGEPHYVVPRGMSLRAPALLPGYGNPDWVED